MILNYISYQAKNNGQGDLVMAILLQIKREKMLAFLEALKEQHNENYLVKKVFWQFKLPAETL